MSVIEKLRDQSEEQLQNQLEETKKELFELYNEQMLTHKLDKPHFIREKKKHIARILTILSERKKEEKHAAEKK